MAEGLTGHHQEVKTYTIEDWEKGWKEGDIGFHEANGHAGLRKHLPAALKSAFGENVPKDLKVFVPLCGKSVDMMLFYSMGFSVIGVEFVQQAAEEFFSENNLEKKEGTPENIFSTVDGRLQILVNNILAYNAENLPHPSYDIIWDRGSFMALNKEDQQPYATLLSSIMSRKACLYLMSVFDFPKSQMPGPPFPLTKEELELAFDKCSFEEMYREDQLEAAKKMDTGDSDDNCEYFFEVVYKVSLK